MEIKMETRDRIRRIQDAIFCLREAEVDEGIIAELEKEKFFMKELLDKEPPFERKTNFYSSATWKGIRRVVLEKTSCCERCGSSNNLVVHHKVPRNDGGDDGTENLKVVCKSCHIKEHIDIARRKYPPIKYSPTVGELESMGLLT